MLKRAFTEADFQNVLDKNKILIVYGPRQVGKTTLIHSLLQKNKKNILKINADEKKYISVLSSQDLNKIQGLIAGYDGLFIDEAQRVPNIGINLKIIHDALPNFRLIVTGSSSFDLANRIQEPLTGRTLTYTLFPISIMELMQQYSTFELKQKLEELLVYGSYPEVIMQKNLKDKLQLLNELSGSYLYKDVLEVLTIRKSEKMHDLLRLLAFQGGSLVSLNELARSLEMSKETVDRYLDLLEKSFVIFRLRGFSRNLRKEIVKMDKIYFVDNGIRNAILEDFTPFEKRQDIGKLWENFVISERRKTIAYQRILCRPYFWRTYTGAELDYVEESAEGLLGIEIKWKKNVWKAPKSWIEEYPNAVFRGLNQDTLFDFLSA